MLITGWDALGTAIGLCAAVGVALGGLLGNPVLWLGIGAGIGVVVGAVATLYKNRDKSGGPFYSRAAISGCSLSTAANIVERTM